MILLIPEGVQLPVLWKFSFLQLYIKIPGLTRDWVCHRRNCWHGAAGDSLKLFLQWLQVSRPTVLTPYSLSTGWRRMATIAPGTEKSETSSVHIFCKTCLQRFSMGKIVFPVSPWCKTSHCYFCSPFPCSNITVGPYLLHELPEALCQPSKRCRPQTYSILELVTLFKRILH